MLPPLTRRPNVFYLSNYGHLCRMTCRLRWNGAPTKHVWSPRSLLLPRLFRHSPHRHGKRWRATFRGNNDWLDATAIRHRTTGLGTGLQKGLLRQTSILLLWKQKARPFWSRLILLLPAEPVDHGLIHRVWFDTFGQNQGFDVQGLRESMHGCRCCVATRFITIEDKQRIFEPRIG